MDATAVYSAASWILAELIRIFHGTSTVIAQATVDALVERKLPLVWAVGDVRRVLDTAIPTADQVLVLSYSVPGWTPDKDLSRWVEYSTTSMFRKRVLQPLHKARLIEFDSARGMVQISPLGSRDVEDRILKLKKI